MKKSYAQHRSNSTTLASLLGDDHHIHEIGKLGKKGKTLSFPMDDRPGK